MRTESKPIATPKKGKVPEFVKRESKSGRFIDSKTKKRTASDAGRSLALMLAGIRSNDHEKMRTSIKKGLKFSTVPRLGKALDISQKDVAQLLSITPSTLNRRKKQGHLHPDESDRVVRFARLKDAVVKLMQGDDQAAILWLRTPLAILGGESPLDYATTEIGARDVEDLIGRLQYGVFS